MSAAIGEDCGATMTTKEIMRAGAKAFKKIHREVCDMHKHIFNESVLAHLCYSQLFCSCLP